MRHRRPRRHGTVYLIVVGAAILVSLMGVAGLTALRIERQIVVDAENSAQARLYARGAVEIGMLRIDEDELWRTTNANGVWLARQQFSNGHFALEGIDPDDADLANSPNDPLLLTGIGECGRARQKVRVLLFPKQDPLAALKCAIHAGGDLQVAGGATLVATEGPASTNALAQMTGTLQGSLQAAALSGSGTVTGVKSIPAEAKELPSSQVFNMYRGLATELALNGPIQNKTLAPGLNNYGGATNASGAYYINTMGSDLEIKNSRIHGTLIIDAPGRTVTISERVLLHSYRSDYPVLIVRGNLRMAFNSGGATLQESTVGVNFNAAGAPYEGASDAANDDTYPSEIQGLVHVTGSAQLEANSRVRGSVLVEGSVVVASGVSELIHTDSLYANPPEGYLSKIRMITSPGSWRRSVD